MDREIAVIWIYKALELKPGESLSIHCNNRFSMREQLKVFRKELELLSEISYKDFSSLNLKTKFFSGRFWIILERVTGESSEIAFKKSISNEIEKIKL